MSNDFRWEYFSLFDDDSLGSAERAHSKFGKKVFLRTQRQVNGESEQMMNYNAKRRLLETLVDACDLS